MSDTKIEWCKNPDGSKGKTWNPVTGCTKISLGCQNCYAERMAHRLQAMGQNRYRNGFKVTCHPEVLDEPLRWKKPSRIFVCSMSDLFHDDVSDQFLLSVLLTIWQAPQHTFLILTKRPDRMEKFIKNYYRLGIQSLYSNIPLSNLWLGVTAENQEQADKRIPILLQIPAAKRFVSVEPMLSTINISKYLRYDCDCGICNFCNGGKPLDMIDWVINGGESGPGARPVHPDWMRSLRDQCKAAGTPFLFKQFGEWYPINGTGRLHGEEDKAIKPYCWISLDGETSGSGCEPDSLMVRVGKHKAGRLLDGQLWDQYPESES